MAERNIVRCDNIISELLDFTRKKEVKLKQVNIDKWLGELLDELEIPNSIELFRKFDVEREVHFGKEHLRRAVINIVDNAIHSMQEQERQKRLTVSTQINGDNVEILFRDTGEGIPEENLGKIFEPLFSSKSFGVGLGLPIVRQIMEQHHGGIEISSELDSGTDVTLWVPV